MFISRDIMWIKKAWLQKGLCASAWPVFSMQHSSFFGAMAWEGFLMWIILLPSWFECSGCVQSILEGTGGVLLCHQEMCWHLYRGCKSGYLWCCFYLQWKEDFVAERALWFLTFWNSGRAHAALWCQFGPAGAEKLLALAVLLSMVPDLPVVRLSWMSRTVEPDQQRLIVAELSLEAAISKGIFGDTLFCLFFSSLRISSPFNQARKVGARMPKARWTCHPNTAHPVEHPCGQGTCRGQKLQGTQAPAGTSLPSHGLCHLHGAKMFTESIQLEKMSEIKTSLWLNTTLASRPWHKVLHAVFP